MNDIVDEKYIGWKIPVGERYGGWTLKVDQHVCGLKDMWVNIKVGEWNLQSYNMPC